MTEHLRIPFGMLRQISLSDRAYAEGDPLLRPFYRYEPGWASFQEVIQKRKQFPIDRKLLVNTLREQYDLLDPLDRTADQIQKLEAENTFTVVTAHQPCLFTGPLFFIYKIISTIRIAQQLSLRFPDHHFVPVFVIGGEDHDFAEINHARLYGKTISWQQNGMSGAVGDMPARSLSQPLEELKSTLGPSEEAAAIYSTVEMAYTRYDDFATATQALLHAWFGKWGLIVINMNRKELKRAFIPVMREELMQQSSHSLVEETQEALAKAGFPPQAFSRNINLFYLRPGLRERIIIEEDGRYIVNNTDLQFRADELLTELESHPERFSPNVILRPLYQETILPNLAYIGGGGEIAYWLERLSLFDHFGIPFPMLVRRHSVLWIDKTLSGKMQKAGLSLTDLTEKPADLQQLILLRQAGASFHLDEEKRKMEEIFSHVASKAAFVDPTLEKYALAECAKLMKGIEGIEDRLRKSEKQKHDILLQQVSNLQQKLFPGDSLQERTDNCLPFLVRYGPAWFDALLQQLDPFAGGFDVLIEKEDPSLPE